MIHCNAWPRVKIGGNAKVRGNVGSIIGVEVGVDRFDEGSVMVGEGGMCKDVDGEFLFTIILKWLSPNQSARDRLRNQ